jgi:hypothetical protein
MSLILDGTNGLSDVDGSAATPAIRGSDANTGVFFGADIIGFSEGGTECARFNADAQFVAAAGTALLPVITTTGDVNTGIFFPAADTIAFAEGGAESMRIDSSGNLGIGKTPSVKLDVQGAASTLTFKASTAEGRGVEIIVGNADGSAGPIINCNTGAGLIIRTQTAGVSLANGATSWAAVSDERNKENLAPILNAIYKVNSLRTFTGKYKNDAEGTSRSFLIAQDVQAVLPEAIDISADEDKTLSLRYTDVIPLLVAAIKEQQQIITALTARVEALEGAQA